MVEDQVEEPGQPRGMSPGVAAAIILGCIVAALVLFGLIRLALYSATARAREKARIVRCRNNLNCLAKGMATYLNEYGDNRFYPWPVGRPGCGMVGKPDFHGAEWLASLYWTQVIPDPDCFLCPASGDTNGQGSDLGRDGAPGGMRLPGGAVSYAGLGDRSVGIYLTSKQGKAASYASSSLAIRDDFPPNEPMASDDTDEPVNHGEKTGNGMSVLFFDSHVEFWSHTKVDLETGVGRGELCALMN